MTSTATHLTADPGPGQPCGAAADGNGDQDHPASGLDGSARSADRTGDRQGPAPDTSPDRSVLVPGRQKPIRSWPLLVLAAPAAVAVWSGWVGIGQMTGFGEIRPLPGIWDSLHIDTAVTLPIGVEAYAAFALHAWLTNNPTVSDRTRGFARWSAIAALVLGIAGQVAYHLLPQAGVTRAPWEVTTVVSCLPVLVLGMGSALAHLLRSDASALASAQAPFISLQTSNQRLTGQCLRDRSGQEQSRLQAHTISARPDCPDAALVQHHDGTAATREPPWPPARALNARPPAPMRPSEAYTAAATVIASGQRVSRRSLRSAGLHGSNADLGILARLVRARPTSDGSQAALPEAARHAPHLWDVEPFRGKADSVPAVEQ
jgi:hypothetical protein